MRKILCTFLLTLAVLYGKSQLILNEFYSNPNSGRNEFFELYNTNIHATGVQLDCYTLIAYWKTNKDSGFYVLDLPDIGIKNQRYYVGASAININVQGTSATADFNWNALGTTGTGYLRKYQVVKNGSNISYNDITANSIISPYNDVFQPIHGGGDLAVFLFKEGVYVNGLIVGFNTSPPTSLPSQILNMPNLTVNYSSTLGSTCTGSFTINWKTITSAEFSTGGGSGGSDNGFARAYDGSCGTWVKTSNSPNHTPGRANESGNSTVTPLIQTVERRICGTQIDFQITSATYQTAFPVTVQLYLDDNADGQLDANDPIDPVYQVQINSASGNIYTISNLDPAERYILVYRTALGCYDKVATPSPLNIDLITTQKNICNQRLDFTVGTPTTNTATYMYYSLPMEVLLFNDTNKDGILNEDTTNKQNLLAERTVTSLPVSGSFDIPQDTKVIIVYKTAYGCFSKIGQLIEVTGNLLTTQINMCGKRIDFSITGASNTDVASYILSRDISVQLVVDETPIGSPQTINFSSFPYSSSIVVPDGSSPIESASKVELVYTPFFTCFATTTPATYTTPTITLSGDISCPTNVAGKSTLSFTIQSVSDPLAYPIKLWYVEDNGTSNTSTDDITIEHPDHIISIPNSPFTAELQNLKSNATLYAQSVQAGCATGNSIVPNNCTVLPVHFQSFNATRNKEKKEQVVLKWVTATEQNNRGFNIQRKISGQWKNIAFIFSQAEHGNSSTPLAYEYKDMNVLNTVTQYQIQQVDYDGKTSYSDIKAVPGIEQKKAVLIYPNPGVDGKINLLFSEIGGVKEIIVSDMNGRIVKQYRQVTENNLIIEGLKSGFYTIKITDRTKAFTTVEKVIIR